MIPEPRTMKLATYECPAPSGYVAKRMEFPIEGVKGVGQLYVITVAPFERAVEVDAWYGNYIPGQDVLLRLGWSTFSGSPNEYYWNTVVEPYKVERGYLFGTPKKKDLTDEQFLYHINRAVEDLAKKCEKREHDARDRTKRYQEAQAKTSELLSRQYG